MDNIARRNDSYCSAAVVEGVPNGRIGGNLKQKEQVHFTNYVSKEKEGGDGEKRKNESLLLSVFEVRVYG